MKNKFTDTNELKKFILSYCHADLIDKYINETGLISEVITDEMIPEVAMIMIYDTLTDQQTHLLIHHGSIEEVFYEEWPPEPSAIIEML